MQSNKINYIIKFMLFALCAVAFLVAGFIVANNNASAFLRGSSAEAEVLESDAQTSTDNQSDSEEVSLEFGKSYLVDYNNRSVTEGSLDDANADEDVAEAGSITCIVLSSGTSGVSGGINVTIWWTTKPPFRTDWHNATHDLGTGDRITKSDGFIGTHEDYRVNSRWCNTAGYYCSGIYATGSTDSRWVVDGEKYDCWGQVNLRMDFAPVTFWVDLNMMNPNWVQWYDGRFTCTARVQDPMLGDRTYYNVGNETDITFYNNNLNVTSGTTITLSNFSCYDNNQCVVSNVMVHGNWLNTGFAPSSVSFQVWSSTEINVFWDNKYRVYYDSQGKTGGTGDYEAFGPSDWGLSLPTPTKTGYTFAGWWTKKVGGVQITGSNVYRQVGSVVRPYFNTFDHQHWEAFDANNYYYNGTAQTVTLTGVGGWEFGFKRFYAYSGIQYRITGSAHTNGNRGPRIAFYSEGVEDSDMEHKRLSNYVDIAASGETNIDIVYTPSTTAWIYVGINYGYCPDGSWTQVQFTNFNVVANQWGSWSDGWPDVLFAHWSPDRVAVEFNPNGGTIGVVNTTTMSTAGGLIATINGRNYTKTNAETAYYCVVKRSDNWCGPFLVGSTSASVAFCSTNNPSGDGSSLGTTTYNGATYYYSNIGSAFNGDWYDLSTTGAARLTIDSSDTLDAVSKLLRSRIVNSGAQIGTLPTPTRTGYTFAGWWTAASGGTQISATQTVSGRNPVTYYAHWTLNNYTITFAPNGGTLTKNGSNLNSSNAFTATYNSIYLISNYVSAIERTGYDFLGWKATGLNTSTAWVGSTPSNGGTITANTLIPNSAYIRNLTATANGTVTLTAQWQVNTYKLTLSTNRPSTTGATWTAGTTAVWYKYSTATYYSNSGCTSQLTNNKITIPVCTGYTFNGYFTSTGGGGTKYIDNTGAFVNNRQNVASNSTLQAYWTAKTYTLTYNPNNGTVSPTSKTVTYDATYGTLATPTRAGHSFAGWFTSANGGTQITASTKYTTAGNSTIYAHWNVNTIKLTLNNQSATSAGTTAVWYKYNTNTYYSNSGCTTTITSITKPTRTGYTFGGYYTATNGGGTQYINNNGAFVNNPYTAITVNTTLNAKWTVNSYTLTLNPNSGTLLGGTSFTQNYGTLKTVEAPTRTGYDFNDWTISGQGSLSENITTTNSGFSAAFTKAQKTDTDGSTYAKYTMNRTSPTANTWVGVNYPAYTIVSGHTYKLTFQIRVNTLTNTGITIRHAAVANDYWTGATTKAYGAGSTTNGWVTVTLSRVINATYTNSSGTVVNSAPRFEVLTYNLASTSTVTQVVDFDIRNVTVIDTTNNTVAYASKIFVYGAGNTTLTAKWQAITVSSAVKYNKGWASSGTVPAAQNVAYDSNVKISDNALTKEQTSTSFTITYNGNGGTSAKTTDTGYKYSNYAPAGWSNVDNSSTVNSTYYDSAKATGKTIKMTWLSPLNLYPVFTINYTYNNYTLPTATRTGYNFAGWYTAASGGTIVGNAGASVSPQSATTYYAHWTAKTYTLSYNANGGSVTPTSKTVTYDAAYGTLPTPTRTGYRFDGWFTAQTGGTQVTATTIYKTADNSTIWAHWTAKGYNIIYNKDDGASCKDTDGVAIVTPAVGQTTGTMANTAATSGTAVTLRANTYELAGYTFKGWATASSGAKVYNNQQSITLARDSDLNLYAVWERNNYTITYAQGVTSNATNLPTAQTAKYYNSLNLAATTNKMVYDDDDATTTNTLTITYNYNGNGQANTTDTSSKTVTYTHDGWVTQGSTDIDGGLANATSGSVANQANKLYAGALSVLMPLNGTTLCPHFKSTTGSQASITAPNPTRAGYTLLGWYTAATGGTKVVAGGASFTPSSTTTLFAQWKVNSYKVTVDPNGGTFASTTNKTTYTQNYGTNKTIGDPTRTGYTFKGWLPIVTYDNADWVEVFYHYNKYGSILFASADDLANKPVNTAEKFSILNQLGSLATSGTYEFVMFWTDISGIQRWKQTSNPATTYNSVTGYQAISVPFTQNNWSGLSKSTDSSVTFIDGSVGVNWFYAVGAYSAWRGGIPAASTANKEVLRIWVKAGAVGANLAGFTGINANADALGTNNVYYFKQEDITLRAVWQANTYQVKFNPNGGSGTMANQTFTYDAAAVALNANTFTRNGYSFKNWNTAANGTGTTYANKAQVRNLTGSGEFNLYAQWTANTYKLTLDNQSATTAGTAAAWYKFNTATFYSNEACTTTLSNNKISVPAKTGRTFNGYYTATGGGGTKYIDASGAFVNNVHQVYNNTNLYAYWTDNRYTITLSPQKPADRDTTVGNGDGTTGIALYYTHGYYASAATNAAAITSITNPSAGGYTFLGYYTNANSGGVVDSGTPAGTQVIDATGKIVGSNTLFSANSTIYGVWKHNTYTISYNKGNASTGTVPGNQTGTYGDTAHPLTLATNLNNNNLKRANTDKADAVVVAFNLNYTSVNTPAPQFNANTVKLPTTVATKIKNVDNQDVTGTATVSNNQITVKTQNKYTSNGWAESSNGAKAYASAASYVFNSTNGAKNKTLYPYFDAVSAYTTITLPSITAWTGRTFLGWYNAATGGTKIGNAGATYEVRADSNTTITLYARWSLNTYTISASANNSSWGSVAGAGTYTYGDTFTLTATPATNCDFDQWRENDTMVGTRADPTYSVALLNANARNYTIIAYFRQLTYEDNGVTFYITPNADNLTCRLERVVVRNANTTLTIPDKINGYTITSMRNGGDDDNITYLKTANPNVIYNQTVDTTTRTNIVGLILNCSHCTNIGDRAFLYCNQISGSVTIPSSVTAIGLRAFQDCKKITSVTLPTGLKTIGWDGFNNCIALTSINIPSSLTSIGTWAFSRTTALTTFNFDTANTTYTMVNDIIYTKNLKTLVACPSGKTGSFSTGSVVNTNIINSSVTAFQNGAFWGAKKLTGTIVVPTAVTNVANSAFRECSGATGIVIHSGVTTIQANSFNGCTGVNTRVVIPSSVTSMAVNAFRYLSNCPEVYFMHDSISTLAFSSTAQFTNGKSGVVYGFRDTQANVNTWGKFTTTYYTNTNYHKLHQITYNANNGSGTPAAQYEHANFTTHPGSTVSRNYYTFTTWNSAANGSGTNYAASTQFSVSGDLNLYAQWTGNVYKIDLDHQGGTNTLNAIYEKYATGYYSNAQATTALGNIPATRTGYDFLGYYQNTNGAGAQIINANGTVTDAAATKYTAAGKIYANWQAYNYVVKFNANNGSGTMGDQTFTYDVAQNLTQNAFTRAGYTFDGWATSATGAVVYSDKQSVKNLTSTKNGTFNLYAHWKANTYTVKFNANGGAGTMADQTFTYAESKALTQNAFTRTGYTFSKWNTKADGTGTNYNDKQAVSNLTTAVNGTVTLYAQWTANVYKITYDTAPLNDWLELSIGSSGLNTGNTGTWGQRWEAGHKIRTITLNSATSNGAWISLYNANANTYVSWSVYARTTSGSVTIGNFGYEKGLTKSVTLNTTWQRIDNQGTTNSSQYWSLILYNWSNFGITVELKDASLKNDTSIAGSWNMGDLYVTYDNGLPELSGVPTRTGYTFQGYFTGANGTGTKYYNADGTRALTKFTNAGNITLKSHWTANTINPAVRYNKGWADGGTVPASQSAVFDKVDGVTLATNALTKNRAGTNYVVTYNGNGGTPTKATDTATKYVVYTAAGWSNQDSQTTPNANYANGKKLKVTWTSPLDLYPVFTLSDAYDDVTLTTATRAGYTFAGWYTAATGGTKIGDAGATYRPTGATQLFAHWTAKTYTVTFNPNGENATVTPTSKTVTYDSTYGDLPTPSRTGYTFAGWYTAASGGSVVTATTKYTTADNTTIFAHWTANGYTVVFNKNNTNATGTMANQSFNYDEQKALTQNGFTYIGYNFTGWATSATGAKVYNDKQSVKNLASTNNATVNLYAVWEAMYLSPAVQFLQGWASSNANLPANINASFDSNITIPVNGMSKTTETTTYTVTLKYNYTGSPADSVQNATDSWVYAPVGWAMADGRTTADYAKNNTAQTVKVDWTTKKVLYPAFSKNRVYEDVTLPTPTRTGYTFNGWNTAQNGSGTRYDAGATYRPTANATLYAQWTANTYTVVFNKNHESATGTMANQTFTYDVAQNLTANAYVRTGYTFVSWNTAANGSGTTYTNKQNVINLATSGTFNLYAIWEANAYKLTLNNQNATTAGTTAVWYRYGTATYYSNADCSTQLPSNKISMPQRTGYTFGGYYSAANGGGTQYIDTTGAFINNRHTIAENSTLYAKWTANTYTVVFNKNNTNATGTMANQTFTYDVAQALTQNAFARTGYTFNGWNTAANGSGTAYADKQSVINLATSGTFNLYAQWTANTYTVVFNKNNTNATGTMADQTFTYDVAQNLNPNTYSLTGYTFAGWATSATGDKVYNDMQSVSNLVPSGTTTLYAKWTANTYDVVFNANGGSGTMTAQTFTYDVAQDLKQNTFTRTGYTFSGWNTADNGSGTAYADKQNVINLATSGTFNLYAQWTANTYTVVFNKNNASATGTMENQTFTYDEEQALSQNEFSLIGYTFNGWALTSGGVREYTDQQVVSNLAPSGTFNLYAVWQVNYYDIYYQNGNYATSGTLPGTQTAAYNTTIRLANNAMSRSNVTQTTYNITYNYNADSSYIVTTPTSAQTKFELTYTANGWNTNPAKLGKNLTQNTGNAPDYLSNANFTIPAQHTTLYPNFDYTEVRGSVTLPTPAARTGYTFAGWYTEASDGTKVGDAGEAYTPTDQTNAIVNITLFARWNVNSYDVEYQYGNTPNGAVSGTLPTKQTAAYNTNVNLATNALAKQNYVNATYTLTYNYDGGTGATPSVDGNLTYVYTANGWNRSNTKLGKNLTQNTGTAPDYANGASYTIPAQNTILYPNFDYTEQLDTIQLAAASKQGHTFTGWYTAQTGGNRVGIAGDNYTITKNVTLYARYLVNSYNVILEDYFAGFNGTTYTKVTKLGTSNKNYQYNASASGADFGTNSAVDTYYQNYAYKGCSTAVVDDTNQTTVYRYFAAITNITMYDADGVAQNNGRAGTFTAKYGSNTVENASASVNTYPLFNGQTIVISNITPANGMKLSTVTAGITANLASSNNVYTYTVTTGGDTIELHMEYKVYTISLNPQSNTTAGTAVVYEKYNTNYFANLAATNNITSITIPTYTGHTFKGYYTQQNSILSKTTLNQAQGTQIIDEDGNIVASKTYFDNTNTTNDATTIYALWIINAYSIVGTPNSASLGSVTGSGDYLYGETWTLTAVANENCEFYEWRENDTVFSNSATISGTTGLADRTFIAYFRPLSAEVDGVKFYYTVNDDNLTCTLNRVVMSKSGTLTIPDKLNGYTITAMRNGTQTDNITYLETSNPSVSYNKTADTTTRTYITGLVLNCAHCVNIGDNAFFNTNIANNVVLPNSVTTIGTQAFRNSKITQITLNNGLQTIGNRSFAHCEQLTSVNIPSSVNNIQQGAFGATYALTTFNLDNANTTYTLYNDIIYTKDYSKIVSCPSGKTSVWSINEEVNTNIFNTNATSIEVLAFWGARNITGNLIIPQNLTTVSAQAFYECSGATAITLHDSLTTIQEGAFAGCVGVNTRIIIPASITTINTSAFNGLTSCPEVLFMHNSIATLNLGEASEFTGGKADVAYIFRDTQAHVNSWGKFTATHFTNTNFHFAVKITFDSNGGENTIDPIYEYNKFTTPSDVGSNVILESWNTNAVETGTSYNINTQYNVPNTDTTLYAIWTRGITTIDNATYKFHITNRVNKTCELDNVLMSSRGALVVPNKLIDYTITTMRDGNAENNENGGVFVQCTSYMDSIDLSNLTGLTNIGAYAFNGARVASIIIPNTVTTLNNLAFTNLTEVTQINIPASVTTINGAFGNNANLIKFTIDNANTTFVVKDDAIYTKNYTTLVAYPTGKTGTWTDAIDNRVTTIGNNAFRGATKLSGTLVVNSTITNIGDGAFNDCTNLTRVHFLHNDISTLNVSSSFKGQNANVVYAFYDYQNRVNSWAKFTTTNFTNASYNQLYKVEYNSNGGDGVNPGFYDISGSVYTTPTSAGTYTADDKYRIVGWNTLANGSGTHFGVGVEYNIPAQSNHDFTLYAEWHAPVSVTVTTNLATANVSSNIIDVPYGSEQTVTTSTLDAEFTFDAWYYLDDYNTNSVNAVKLSLNSTYTFVVTQNISLIAVYNYSGSDVVDINHADKLIWLQNVVNSGISFNGITFRLNLDINLDELVDATWVGIGNETYKFAGIFDGRGHTISNSAQSNLFATGTLGVVRNVFTGGNLHANVTVIIDPEYALKDDDNNLDDIDEEGTPR